MADEIKIELVADADGVIRAVQKIGPAGKKAGKSLNDQLKKAETTSKGIGGIYAKVATVLSAIAGVAIGGAFKEGLDQLSEFNLKIAEINTLLPQTNQVSKNTEMAIKRLSGAYGKDARDLAKAYYDIISAGSQDATESLDLLSAATRTSVVGITDVKTATGAILSVLNAYGTENISAMEAGQKLFATVQAGRTNFEELSASIGEVIPIAAQLGIPLEELGGILAVSTRISGSTAKSVTQLGAAFSNILKPSEQSKAVIQRLNQQLGIALDFSAQSLKEKGVQKFLQEIFDATSSFKNQEAILGKLFGSTQALRGVLSVTGENFKEVKKAIDQISDSSTVLDEGFGKISDTLSFKFDKALELSANLFNKFVGIVEPHIISLVDKFNTLASVANVLFDIFIDDANKAKDSILVFKDVAQETDEAIDFLMGGLTGEEQESPMIKFARDAENLAGSVGKIAPEAQKATLDLDNLGKKTKELSQTRLAAADADLEQLRLAQGEFEAQQKSLDNLVKSMNQGFRNGIARATSAGIQMITQALITGQFSFENFSKAIAGILGDMAIQIGEMAIATGITMGFLEGLSSFQAIAAGAALIAIGKIMKSFSGGAGGPSSSMASPVAPVGGTSVGTVGPLGPNLAESEPEAVERQQVVQLTVQGSIFNTEETSKQIIDILNDEFDNQGGRIAYA